MAGDAGRLQPGHDSRVMAIEAFDVVGRIHGILSGYVDVFMLAGEEATNGFVALAWF